MVRELVVLGSASQVPTRQRNHNGYLLRWDGEGFLFDPGEGTQRQFVVAGVAVSAVTCICITHFHGDHCLGLPGVLQRLSLDGVRRAVPVCFPASGEAFFERLRHASAYDDRLDVRPVPVSPPDDGSLVVVPTGVELSVTLSAAPLSHSIDSVGWRVEEPAGRTMLPDRLEAAGVRGPDITKLQRDGFVALGGSAGHPERRVVLDDVSVPRRGQRVAFVMDTAWCDGALALARGCDLLVCEATFAEAERELALRWGHMTARQAGELAAAAGARALVLTHFSQRYPDTSALAREAAAVFDGDVVAATDLDRIPVPSRRTT